MTTPYALFLSQIAARALLVFAALAIGVRLFGKRQIGEAHLLDLVALLCIANAVQNALTASTGDLTTGMVSAGVLMLLARVYAGVVSRFPGFEKAMSGSPTILVSEGRLLHGRMRAQNVTEEQILAALRHYGLTEPSQARLVVLEVDGDLSVVGRDPDRPR